MITVSVHQPSYLVWAPLLEKMARADLFIYLDDVQFTRNSEIHRNKVLTPQGPSWLSLAVGSCGRVPIRDVALPDSSWAQKHWKTLLHCYGKAPHFTPEQKESLGELYQHPADNLLAVSLASTEWLRRQLGITTPVALSSEFGIRSQSSRRILDLCLEVGAGRYLTGPGGLDYMDLDEFEQAGIEVQVQNYRHDPYPQQFDLPAFVPRLSAVDMLFNLGPRCRSEVLARGEWLPAAEVLTRGTRALSPGPSWWQGEEACCEYWR